MTAKTRLISFIIGISLFTLALFSCSSQKSNNDAQKQDSIRTPATNRTITRAMVGGDKDEHGCRASTGYQWSALKQERIRPFDLNTKMKDLTHNTLTGYLLFSMDQKQVEIFAAGFEPAILLSITGKDVYSSKIGNTS